MYVYTVVLKTAAGHIIHSEDFASEHLILGPRKAALIKPFEQEAAQYNLTIEVAFTEAILA